MQVTVAWTRDEKPPLPESDLEVVWSGSTQGPESDPFPASYLSPRVDVGHWYQLRSFPDIDLLDDGTEETSWTEVVVQTLLPGKLSPESVAVRPIWAAKQVLRQVLDMAGVLARDTGVLWIRVQ